jgi:hypothetical protein
MFKYLDVILYWQWPSSISLKECFQHIFADDFRANVMPRHTSPTWAKPISVLTLREGILLFSSVQLLYVAEL